MDRRTFLRAGVAAVASGAATFAVAGTNGRWETTSAEVSPLTDGPDVRLDPVAEGFREPVDVAFPPDEDDARFVADKYGRIYRHDADGRQESPVLDISDSLASFGSWEQGLLGVAVHPEFASTRKLYLRYSAPPRSDVKGEYSHTFVLSEFVVGDDNRRVDRASERVLLSVPEPDVDHNAGSVVFGPDGYLYVGTGDGGKHDDAGVGHASDWYWLNRGGNGQDVTQNLLGSVLRIDVDGREGDKPYAVPDDNPLVGADAGLDEHWAWGFRNPYRMSFAPDGRLFVTDVGDDRFEEVNLVEKGNNYGWNVREGRRCIANRYASYAVGKLPGLENTYPACPATAPDGEPLRDPVVVYPHVRDGHRFGRAVIGGYVCEDPALSALGGRYVFGDFLGGRTGGRLFAARLADDDGPWPMAEISVSGPDGGGIRGALLSFAEGPDGELYVLTSQMSEGTGTVSRVRPAE